jgi:DNA-binding NtrC family response regulator
MTKKKSILVVDDDATITSILEFMLIQNGYTVSVARSEYEFRSILHQNTPIDIALIDTKVKEASGITLLKELMQTTPLTKCIMMTGYSIDSMIKSIYEQGAFGIIYKPFDAETIMTIIGNIASEQ